MKKKLVQFVLPFIALTSIPAGMAVAGQKMSIPVAIDTVNRSATGALGTARGTADNQQTIGCYITASDVNDLIAVCSARDAAGVNRSCQTVDLDMIQVIGGIGTGTKLTFNWNAAGSCTSISVVNYSHYAPMAP